MIRSSTIAAPVRLSASVACSCLLALAIGCSRQPAAHDRQAAADVAPPSTPTQPRRVESAHLPNAYHLHARVISGGQPEGNAAFAELRALGVRTIISVDGAKPDVATAAQYGLRYVHLPHGYDGISEDRARELAKAVRDLPGPVYIHCHHGKHRSPAAATVACVSLGLLRPDDALATLKTAGTSENYQGLYRAAATARRLDERLLDALAVEFRETVELPPLAEAMVQIEHVHDRLATMAKTGWRAPADHPDLDPAHEALLLKEHFTELARTDAVKDKPARFRKLLLASEQDAGKLESDLRSPPGDQPPDEARAERSGRSEKSTAAFDRVTHHCTECHREFRDEARE